MNLLLDDFDEFVDDILTSDIDLLKGELDFLIIQHLFHSIDLEEIKIIKFRDNNPIAA